MPFTPRQTRIQELAGRAYERTRAESGSIAAAIAEIGLTFGENRRVNDRKLAVENAMCRGAGAIRNRCEYERLALRCPPNVDGALQEIERDYQATIRDNRRRGLNGFPLPHPRVEERLREARLFLRWYRRFGDRARFPAIIDALIIVPSSLFIDAAE